MLGTPGAGLELVSHVRGIPKGSRLALPGYEWLAPRFLGVSERVVLAVYGAAFVLYAVRYRARIRSTAPWETRQ